MTTLERWHWRNWPVLLKLVGVQLVPIVVALILGWLYITELAAAPPAADAGWTAVILLFALGLGVLVAVGIARAMLGPLRTLRRTALDVAEHRLPAAVDSARSGGRADQAIEPVAVHTVEEIGEVARAFDAVHTQAVRLAVEQSQLQGSINDIFVNLSRRSQGLVQRQLSLIEDLERGEQDPETLQNLFQLDHLATRMRRNSENLLVLAGTESARRSGRPEPLVEILRAAISEVEQYQRVVLRPPPDSDVLGRAGGDVVHLLAELLDNATQFSPPDSQVVISGRAGTEGCVVVEVDDRGVGIGADERAALNERLASSATVGASASRRMGLFVVARLAARHGVTVQLGSGEEGVGTLATVTLPSAVVRPGRGGTAEIGEPAAAETAEIGEPAAAVARVPDTAPEPGSNGHTERIPAAAAETAPPGTDGDAPQPVVPAPTPSPDASAGSTGLFQPASEPEPAGEPDPVQPAAEHEQEATLEQSTPIFDEILSAWFQDSESRDAGDMENLGADLGVEQATVVDRHTAGARPADWGAADEGWQAAEAAAESLAAADDAEVTAAGLPRRQPRAHLVPGSAGTGLLPETGTANRSADAVRGRLSSYQRGVREGRHRRSEQQDTHADESDAAEMFGEEAG